MKLKKKGTTVDRGLIAKTIWGEDWMDKYSDWAITQLISQLRKKTSVFNNIVIKTSRGEGFVMI